jgi:hypothetical protein
MALDDKDRAEIAALLKTELSKLVSQSSRAPGVNVRFVGIPIDITDLGRFPGRFPGTVAVSGSDCCNGCD